MPPKVPDIGHRDADKELYSLTRRLHLSYRQASISLREKIEKYLDEFEKEDAKIRALYDSGKLSDEEFSKWREQKTIDTQAWRDMLDQLAEDMTNQNKIAASMINETLPEVYAINHNYGTYEAETGSGRDTTYTMYDKFTVKRLLQDGQLQLPKPSPKVAKDKRWNRQHIQSAVLQGILTGEPMGDIAQRLLSVAKMTESAAIRNARTAVTGAENAGRIDSYIRAQNMGIKMKQVWMATLDSRTRDSHAMMDGEKRDPGKEFSNGCRYPGDPEGKPGEIYNCRCTLVAEVEGADPYNPNLRPSEYLKEEGLTYEQWKEMHRSSQQNQDTFDRNIIQYSAAGKMAKNRLESRGVEYRQVQRLDRQLSGEDIIGRLSGGDMTRGSCFSLACAYAGNVNGLDVIDYRGGASQDEFARMFREIARLKGVSAEIETKGGLRPAKTLLKKVEEGKEYVFNAGRHSAVVRNIGGKLQYLELQSATDSGWHDFEYDTIVFAGTPYERTVHYDLSKILEWRFGCKGRTISESSLIDIESFKDSDEFRDLLGYINTAEDKQKKGTSGSIK